MRNDEGTPIVRAAIAAISAHKLLVVVVVATAIVLVLVVVVVVLFVRSRRAPPQAAAAPPAPRLPQPNADLLRAAWQRFVRGLPRDYRRSILNFEHFVVMGAPAAGKTRLIDAYSDWKRQTKEFAGSQPNDPDLPVFLASSEVIMELPARVLDDHSGAVYRMLTRLWRPLYSERAPTVVVVVDLIRLAESPAGVVLDLAEKMRGKINVLSGIRRRAVEVRVALTHLDELEGYRELTDFCRDREIPLCVPPSPERVDLGRHIEAWFDDLRGYLPNALTSLESADFRRIVSFLRRAPEISAVLRPFLKALYQHETLAADPIFGGVYPASESPGLANPLQGALESGPGPDPQRRHAVFAAAVAAVCAGAMGLAFRAQHARWSTASQALELYTPNDEAGVEPFRRAEVTAFTSKNLGWLRRTPDFFGAARAEMRGRFSDRIRRFFLMKRMQEVIKNGAVHPDAAPMAARRCAYYLALIHSDKDDRLHIAEPGQAELWASMIELRNDLGFISDYLANVDEAYKTPVNDLELPDQGVDPRDSSKDWIGLLERLQRALVDGVVSRDELGELQQLTKALGPRLQRFDDDVVMRRALHEIDTAAGTDIYKDGERQRPGTLERFYNAKFEAFERHVAWADDQDLLPSLRRVVDTVKDAAAAEVATPRTLEELVFRLEQDYGAAKPDADAAAERAFRISLDGTELRLPTRQWEQILRDSSAQQSVESFLNVAADQEIFFGPEASASLSPVRWNPNGDGAAVFVGHGVLDGRYTKVAYDKHVSEVVQRLQAVLAKATLSADVRLALTVAVSDQVARYAARYREEALRFTQSFDVQAGSQEGLRVALAQMTSDVSAFNDFLVAVDRNTRLAAPTPLLSGVRVEMMTFESWHQAVDGGGNAPELGKYKAILGQLLVDLGSASASAPLPEAAGPAPPSADTSADTLEEALTPAGRLYLAALRGDKGSYAGLVETWLTSVHMPDNQRKAFRAPLRRLAELGRADIERTLRRVWQVEMQPSLQRLAMEFPFNRAAAEEASPQELRDLFHPKEGRFFDLFRRYVEPIAELSGRSGFRPRAAVAHAVSLPPGLFQAANAAAALSSRLWDESGNPLPLELRISTVPFERGAQPRREGDQGRKAVLTLMHLSAGEGSVFNFNQQPSLVTVAFDWTKDHRSQVGVQLTDVATKESSFPAPVVSRGTYWSFHHLLLRARDLPVKSPPAARLYTWHVWYQPDAGPGEMIPVRFVVVNDPWEPFAALAQLAPRVKETPREARKAEPEKRARQGAP